MAACWIERLAIERREERREAKRQKALWLWRRLKRKEERDAKR